MTGSEISQSTRVLVVEDSRAMRTALAAKIEVLGHMKTEVAASLTEAERLLRADPERFALAVLDLNLPDAPHGEVVDLMGKFSIPSVVLTATLARSTREAVLAKGVVDYEVKGQGTGLERIIALVRRIQHFRNSKILVVDDSRSCRGFLASLLGRRCYQTVQAENGRDALQLLESMPEIEMALVDYHLPDLTGDTLVTEMRKLRPRDELAIIGISGADKGTITVPMLKSGANDFIAKPFEVEEFYARVDQNLDVLRYLKEARDAASRDFLTKLYNRRHFFSVGETMYANAARGHLMLGAAVLDLDHFKSVNDTYGHEAGDRVLVEVASALRTAARKTDLVARFGGEEFVCLLSLRAPHEAMAACERIRKTIENLKIVVGEHLIPVTASIGLTTDRSDSLKGMLRLADEGVYKAKEQGRNRVVQFEAPSIAA